MDVLTKEETEDITREKKEKDAVGIHFGTFDMSCVTNEFFKLPNSW